MSDRLPDLQRQRALAQEQLAWIDREIARETGQAPAPGAPLAPASAPAARAARPAPSDVEAARMADEILTRYQQEAASSPAAVKRGCFLYFGLAFVVLAAGVAALYFYSASKH